MKKFFYGKLLGRELVTDNPTLLNVLDMEAMGERGALERMFPGFSAAVVAALKLLDVQRTSATHIFYLNHRIQAWALGYDVGPSPTYRILPAELATKETAGV